MPQTKRTKRISTEDIVMQRIRQHCEEMESRGITLEKLIEMKARLYPQKAA